MKQSTYRVAVISASVREGRKSHRVALYLQKELQAREEVEVELLDLAELNFPIFHERLKYQKNPSDDAKAFAQAIANADGVIIVTPEYNSGYPAALKNAIDLLVDEWYRKPVAIATVSGGSFAGMQVLVSLQFMLWKLKAWTVPAMFPVPQVQESFNGAGVPTDEAATKKRADKFFEELFYCMEATGKMKV
jgi:NAD(P)H-dependent FMN reductase